MVKIIFVSQALGSTKRARITSYNVCYTKLLRFNEEISFKALTSIIEISTIANMTKYCYTYIPLIVAIVAFGGFCVITQIRNNFV